MSNISVNSNKTVTVTPTLSGTFGIPTKLALNPKIPKSLQRKD